jgi:Zn-finger nucleic acid-binding protein
VERQHGDATMICPACGARLETVVRQGVEIDRCPDCRGIWLDRGELEKLVTLGGGHTGTAQSARPGGDDGEPDPANKLATRRSFFAALFDVD